MIKNKIIAVIAVLCVCLTLSGAGWFGTTKVTVDTESNYVYELCTAQEILSEFATNGKTAREKYQGVPVLVTGKVVSVGSGGKNIVVTGMETSLSVRRSFILEIKSSESSSATSRRKP